MNPALIVFWIWVKVAAGVGIILGLVVPPVVEAINNMSEGGP